MYYIVSDRVDPAYNMAFEEFIAKELEGSYFVLWQNQPTIVLGRHQNIYQEINLPYVIENDIKIIRRNSGGGCVYHDLGNVNYGFVQDQSSSDSFHFFMQPIIDFLKEYNIAAQISGRNDIQIDEQKISGNAQYFFKNRIVHHGTLLFDSDLSVLSKCLNVNKKKLEAKGITSVKSRVTNLITFFNNNDINSSKAFIDALLKFIDKNNAIEKYTLNEDQIKEIEKLAQDKYRNDTWLYNKLDDASFTNDYRNNFGLIEVRVTIEDKLIKDINFFGDYFSKKEISEVIEKLKNIPYTKQAINDALSNFEISDYFIGFSQEEILNVIFA